MPVKCPYCETNTHTDKDRVDKCDRVFLSPDETFSLLDKSYHTFIQAGPVLIGADGEKKATKESLKKAKYIVICDPEGVARKMSHGIATLEGKQQRFYKTDEKKLASFEKLLCL